MLNEPVDTMRDEAAIETQVGGRGPVDFDPRFFLPSTIFVCKRRRIKKPCEFGSPQSWRMHSPSTRRANDSPKTGELSANDRLTLYLAIESRTDCEDDVVCLNRDLDAIVVYLDRR